MQDRALAINEGTWDDANLPVLIDKAVAEVCRDWHGRGRPNVHELLYEREGRRILVLFRLGSEGKILHGMYASHMQFRGRRVYFFISDAGALYFSREKPEDRKFKDTFKIEEIGRCFGSDLHDAFRKNVYAHLNSLPRSSK